MGTLKIRLNLGFDIKVLAQTHYGLVIEIICQANSTFITQRKYALEIIRRFRMTGSKTHKKPMEEDIKFPN